MALCTHPLIPTLHPSSSIGVQSVTRNRVRELGLVHTGLCVMALFFAGSAMAADPSQARAEDTTAPAYNWSLPLFTKEGFRQMTARGTEARAVDKHRLDVVDLNLTLFSGDAASRVDTILLSPAATFLPDAKIAQGHKSVRYIGEVVEATGTRWIYRHEEKKISLDGSVRVTFHAELKNLLQ